MNIASLFNSKVQPLYENDLKALLDMKNPDIQIIAHDDMDGYSSAATVAHRLLQFPSVHKSNISVQHYDYSGNTPHILSYADIVFIVDYSATDHMFAMEIIENMERGMKIFWIDHHQSSIDICNDPKFRKLRDVPGIRNTEYCATLLAYAFLNPSSKTVPTYIRLVDDFDCWKKKDKNSDYLNNAFCNNPYFPHDALAKEYDNLIYDINGNFLGEMLMYGKEFNIYITDYDRATMKEYGFLASLTKFPDITLLCRNSPGKGSQGLSDFYHKITPKYGCVFGFDGKQFILSIYSEGNVSPNAQKICEAYGGGGHPGAGGFTIKTNPFINDSIKSLDDLV